MFDKIKLNIYLFHLNKRLNVRAPKLYAICIFYFRVCERFSQCHCPLVIICCLFCIYFYPRDLFCLFITQNRFFKSIEINQCIIRTSIKRKVVFEMLYCSFFIAIITLFVYHFYQYKSL